MLAKSAGTRNGSLIFGLLGIFAVSVSTENSIMDIVNVEKVEKLLAERRENGSRDDLERRMLLQNSIDAEETVFAGDEDEDEGTSDSERESDGHGIQRGRHKFPANNVYKHDGGKPRRNPRQHNLTGVPDFSTILADLTGAKVEKALKSDNNPILVTRKEYLKKDWCKTEPIIQKIREEGCLTRTLLNRFCYGQCNSFYIPKNPPKKKRNRNRPIGEDESEESATFRSCGFCKPKKASWMMVTLRCPATVPRFRKKKVHRIKQCKCIAENFGP